MSGFRRLGLAGPDLRYVAIHLAGRLSDRWDGIWIESACDDVLDSDKIG